MSEEDKFLKNEFKHLMDDNFSDIPTFQESTTPKKTIHQRHIKVGLGIIGCLLILAFLYNTLSNKKESNKNIPVSEWPGVTASLLTVSDNQTTITNWTSPTDFLMNNNIKPHEE